MLLVRIEDAAHLKEGTSLGIRTEIYTMGNNANGQLGIWSRDNSAANYLPRRVRGPVNATTGLILINWAALARLKIRT